MGAVVSRHAREALQVLGAQVAAARRERGRSAADVAERAGISRTTLSKIEHGNPTVAIGTVFEVATIVGVPLFGADRSQMSGIAARMQDRLALLPERVRAPSVEVDDDF